jgi:acyl dehydratase
MIDSSLIGKVYPPFRFRVEQGKIAEFARAICDNNPIYFDETVAKKAGFEAIPAPATYGVVKAFYQTGETWPDYASLGLDWRYILHGEMEFIYHNPMVSGQVLRVQNRIKDINEKKGSRGGTMIFLVIESTYEEEESGKRILTALYTIIQTGGTVKDS